MLEVPESVEEFDQLAGRQGACLDSAVSNAVFRGHLNKARAAIVTALIEATGIARDVIGKDGDKDVLESEKDYVDRVTKGEGKTINDYADVVAKAVDSLGPIDLTGARSGGPTKEYLAAADAVIEGIKAGKTTTDSVISKLVAANASISEIAVDEEGLPDRDALAVALRVNRERVIAAANAEMFA